MSRRMKQGLVGLAVVTLLAMAGGAYAYYRYSFPYGWSHCCDKQLDLALYEYAERHEGWYARGEATPEASLSLLFRENPYLANVLRGKTVPEAAVLERLQSGQLLTPETCGWHYVEGLRKGDDPRLALFWDKVGLGHNGGRLPDGGHHVWFLGGPEYISGEKWDSFLEEQGRLRAKLGRRP
jgi:hypothetical protein